jgi:hypothetical protein
MTKHDPDRPDVPGEDPSGTVVSAVSAHLGPADQAGLAGRDQLSTALVQVSEPELPAAERRTALGQLAAALRSRGFVETFKPKAVIGWISDTVVDLAPRIPLRTLPTLRSQHLGLSGDEIADRIVSQAARVTATIGAVGGGLTSMEWVAPPTLLTAPAVLAAETVAVVAVELKMLGELQELYGQPIPGGSAQRAASLVQAWATRRGVNLLVPGRAMTAVLGTAARTELRTRLMRRFGRNLTMLGPLLTGAAIAAFLNQRATKRLAAEIREDLRKRRPTVELSPPSS